LFVMCICCAFPLLNQAYRLAGRGVSGMSKK